MDLRLEIGTALASIDPGEWDALVGPDDPFVEHAFLYGLERSKSVGEGTGWLPIHVTAREGSRLVGALPLYAKGDSWGEFIFDFAWAHAARRAGIAYYPKLVSMVPFTPATGRRLLVAGDVDRDAVRRALVRGALAATEETKASSLHLLFLTPEERDLAMQEGLRARLSIQFHWDDDGFQSFDDYLARFRADKRKQVKKERRRALEGGLEIRVKEGPELDAHEWSEMSRLYRDNCRRHGSYAYLTPAFFDELRAHHAHRVVALFAYREGRVVAVSLCFQKGAHLYGRDWGADEAHEMLHFELCYYRPIERAIAQKLRHFEAGAQGAHKLKRGLMPARVHSAHHLRDPRLREAVFAHLPLEAHEVEAELAYLAEHGPFHRG
ncbi:MAG: GNAT family N-acetyltransferase [Sandaracinaceae bacterium]|nr:GNAT family N-acetyltransferase [Sandaracinaceae bacterium]